MSQLQEIFDAASHIALRIKTLPTERAKHRYVRDCRSTMKYVLDRTEELIRLKKEENNASTENERK